MKKTTISAIAAVSAAGAIALGLGAITDWYKNWNAKSWFNYWGKGTPTTEEKKEPDTPKEDKAEIVGAQISNSEKSGITVMTAKLPRAAYSANGISEQAEKAFMLTATIDPSNAENKEVDWTIVWADGAALSSEPVTDYVTVTPTADGALTARVACIKPFRNSNMYIKVTARADTAVFALCTVTYSGLPSAISANDFYFSTTSNNFGSVNFTLSNEYNDVGEDFYSSSEISYSYTVSGNVTIGQISIDSYGNFSVVDEHQVTATKDMISIIYYSTEKRFEITLGYDKNSYVLAGSNHSVSISFTIKCRDVSTTVTGIYKAAVTNVSLDNSSITF